MSIEREIMCAIVRADMFLVSAWKYMLTIIVVVMIVSLITIKKK